MEVVVTIMDIQAILDIPIQYIRLIKDFIVTQTTIITQVIILLVLFLAYHLDIDLRQRTYIMFPWELISEIDSQAY